MNNPEAITQAELLLIMIGQVDAIGTHISIFLTIISAYLIVSYLVGRKLTSLQVSVATSIYIVSYIFEAIILAGLYRTMINSVQAYRERFSVINPTSIDSITVASYVGVMIIIAILLSSLWFMWGVRHSEKESREKNS